MLKYESEVYKPKSTRKVIQKAQILPRPPNLNPGRKSGQDTPNFTE